MEKNEDVNVAERSSVNPTNENITESEENKKNKIIKIILLIILVGIIIYIALDYSLSGLGHVNTILVGFLEWVEKNPGLGALAFAGVYVITTILFIPGSLLTLGAGLVFGRALGIGYGVLVGSIAVFAGASLGAVLAFLLGRYVLQDTAQKLFDKFNVLKAVDKAIEKEGLKLVILLRLSPIIPFSAFNYVMGLTRVNLKHYSLGCIGMIPGTVAYVFIGSSTAGLLGTAENDGGEDSGGNSNNLVTTIVLVVGSVATVIAVVLITIAARRALQRVLKEAEEEMELEEEEKHCPEDDDMEIGARDTQVQAM